MHDSTTLKTKLDDHTQAMIHSADGTLDAYGCEARAWMYAGMQELIELTAFDTELIDWLDHQQVALIDLAHRARRARFLR